jgi:methyl-accepting chemotaxis protein
MTHSGFTIGKRLTIGFGGVLVLMAVLAGLAIQRVGQIDTILTRINDVNSVKQRYAINFRGSVHDRAIALRDVVLASSPEATKVHADLIGKLDARYQESAGPLDALFAPGMDNLPV